MPVYEYLCDSCGKHQEAIQKFSDAPLTDCEICGAKDVLKKQISRSSFALKGTGWYTTDYKKSSKPASAEASTADAVQGDAVKNDAVKTEPAKADAAPKAEPVKAAAPKSE